MAEQDQQERKPKLQMVIDRALEAFAARLPKAMPARVTKYEAGKQRVTCKILVQQPYVDEDDARQVESLPAIPGVPVRFDGAAGGFRSTYPISDGNLILSGQRIPATLGLLVFCDRSLDKWLTGSGAEVDPEFDHQHALADAVFLPGLNPFGAPIAHVPTDKMSIGRDASPSDIEIDMQGNVNIGNGSNGAARTGDNLSGSTPLQTWAQAVEAFINGLASGTISTLWAAGAGLPGGLGTIHGGSTKVKIG